ncbi:DNA polymerase zeta [Blyttiomyces sp. JEL0837]|nr:DNA polymerase zeta [Blyttiomyces sp. JEL0837]
MQTFFQTYESHIPYLPQFFIDHNLLGMDYMRLRQVKFRRPIEDIPRVEKPQLLSQGPPPFYFTEENVPDFMKWTEAEGSFPRQSYCELELDAIAIDILNRYDIKQRPEKALIDLTKPADQNSDEKLVPSLASVWEDESKRRRKAGLSGTPPVPPPETNRKAKEPWYNEHRLRNEMNHAIDVAKQDRLSAERGGGIAYITRDSVFPSFPVDDGIPTVFDAISAMYTGGVGTQRRRNVGAPASLSQAARSQRPIRTQRNDPELEGNIDDGMYPHENGDQMLREEDDPDWMENMTQQFENLLASTQTMVNEDIALSQHVEETEVEARDSDAEEGEHEEDEDIFGVAKDDEGVILDEEGNLDESIEHLAVDDGSNAEHEQTDMEVDIDEAISRPRKDKGKERLRDVMRTEEFNEEDYLRGESFDEFHMLSEIPEDQIDQLDGHNSDADDEIIDSDEEIADANKHKRKSKRLSVGSNAKRRGIPVVIRDKPPRRKSTRVEARQEVSDQMVAGGDQSLDEDTPDADASSSSVNSARKRQRSPVLEPVAKESDQTPATNLLPERNLLLEQPRKKHKSANASLSETTALRQDIPGVNKDGRFRDFANTKEVHNERVGPQPSTFGSEPQAQLCNQVESYFTQSIQDMWSPRTTTDSPKWSFFHDPPLPGSPIRESSQTSNASDVNPVSNFTFAELAQEPHNPLSNRPKAQYTPGLPLTYGSLIENDGDAIQCSEQSLREVAEGNNNTLPRPLSPTTQFLAPNIFTLSAPPPTTAELLRTWEEFGLHQKEYLEPYYSKQKDAPVAKRTISNRDFKVRFNGDLAAYSEFDTTNSRTNSQWSINENPAIPTIVTLASGPPSSHTVREWLQTHPLPESKITSTWERKMQVKRAPQLEMPTPKNRFGFKYSQIQTEALSHELQHLVVMSLEFHAQTRKGFCPDPAMDEVAAVFYCLLTEDEYRFRSNGHRPGYFVGMIIVADKQRFERTGMLGYMVDEVPNERALFDMLIQRVRAFDPDILTGYEIQGSSWGFLIERAKLAFGMDLASGVARVRERVNTKVGAQQDQYGFQHHAAISSSGRIFLNVWRLMRAEVNLTSYYLENTVFHILHQRIPKESYDTLTQRYGSGLLQKWRTMKYYLDRVQYNIELLEDTSIISKTRIARPENFVMISPTKDQIRKMRAISCLPLNIEPKSRFYSNPMAILDFQSLYPSVMIGFNYCTCLGRVASLASPHDFGCMGILDVPVEVVETLKDDVHISPNGLIFVKQHIREGVLGRMLKEILDTRFMVKQSMKSYKKDKAMRLVTKHPEWGANVVYGDTDSMFVDLPGKTKARAFEIGTEIANLVTLSNPDPMKLKFEKVYLPCVLLAKKRYVGFMYETIDDIEPTFDAKGIEVIRRDGCPAMAKIMEQSLKILFRTQDMSQLKAYLYDQWAKILTDRVSYQDFLIATEVRMSDYKVLPPGAVVSEKKKNLDPRALPQYRERVPYLIVYKGPKRSLRDSAVSPETVIFDRSLRLHGEYYITRKIIPTLARVFNLVGISIDAWYKEMPRVLRPNNYGNGGGNQTHTNRNRSRKVATIDQFYVSQNCLVCQALTQGGDAFVAFLT